MSTHYTQRFACLACFCLVSVLWSLPASAENNVNTQRSTEQTRQLRLAKIERAVAKAKHALTRPATVALGYDEAKQALEQGDRSVPVIALYLSSTEYAELIKKNDGKTRITAIFGNPEPRAQLALAKQLFPKGTIALVETTNSRQTVKKLTNPYTKVIQAGNNVTEFVRHLAGTDALLALPDPKGVNRQNIQFIIRAMYRQRAAVIGYSQKMVDMGCLASIYPRPEAVIIALKNAIRSYNKTGQLPEPRFVSDYTIGINQRLARSLDLVIPQKEQLLRHIHAEVLAR